MAFIMKGFPLDMDKTPIYQVHDMQEDVMGMANNNVIKHEKIHIDQMKRGDLQYDKTHVTWKGKKYLRSKMEEGNNKLPWEEEAYRDGNELEYT